MKITREEVLRLAKMSNLSLGESEISAMQKDFANILDYISALNEIDTEGVEPTYQVFEMENVWREDEIKIQEAEPKELLALAPDSLNGQIKVPRVL